MEKINVLSAYVELRQRQRTTDDRLKNPDKIKATILRELEIIESLNS